MAAELSDKMSLQASKIPENPNPILLEKAGFQMLQLKLKPDTLLKGFDSPVLLGDPREYIHYLESSIEIAADLVEIIELRVFEDSRPLSDIEKAYFREMQLYIVKKQQGLLLFIHEKIGQFLQTHFKDLEKTLAEQPEELPEMASDLFFFIAKRYPTLFDDLNYYTMQLYLLRSNLEREDPLFNDVVERELNGYQQECERFFKDHTEVLSYLTEAQKSQYESNFKETLRVRELLLNTMFKPGAMDLGTPVLILGMVQAYQEFKLKFEELKKRGQVFFSEISDENNAKKQEAPLRFTKECAEFLAQIRKIRKEYENVNTIFHSELDYAEKVIDRLQRELLERSPGVVSAVSEKLRPGNQAVNQTVTLAGTQKDAESKLRTEQYIKDMEEAIEQHNQYKVHFDSAIANDDQSLPKGFLNDVLIDLEELLTLAKNVIELDSMDVKFSGLKADILNAINEDQAFIAAFNLVAEDLQQQKKKAKGKKKKTKEGDKSAIPQDSEALDAKLVKIPTGKRKKKKKKKAEQTDLVSAKIPNGENAAKGKNLKNAIGQVSSSSSSSSQLSGKAPFYSIDVTAKGVEVSFPPLPPPASKPDILVEDSEEEDDNMNGPSTSSSSVGTGVSREGSEMGEDHSSDGTTLGITPSVNGTPIFTPVLPQTKPKTLRADAPPFVPNRGLQDPELIAEPTLPSSPTSMAATPSTTPPSPSSAASLERSNVELELEGKKQELDRLNSAISQGNCVVNDTAQRLMDLQLALAGSEAYQQQILRRTQAMEFELQRMRSLQQQALYPVLFRTAPPAVVTHLPPPQPVVITAPMPPLQFSAPQIVSRPVVVLPSFPPPQLFAPPPFPYNGQGRGRPV